MSPSSTKKGAIRYRYYVSSVLAEGRAEDAGSISRISAPEIETLIAKAVRMNVRDCPSDIADRVLLDRHLEKVVIKQRIAELFLKHADEASPISLSWTPPPNRRKRKILICSNGPNQLIRPIRAESRARLIEGIAKGRLWLNELVSGVSGSTNQIAAREQCSERSVRMTISLAFLSPTIVRSAIEGTLPYGVGITRLIEPPLDWNDQLEMLQ
jgi:hypothetical protein